MFFIAAQLLTFALEPSNVLGLLGLLGILLLVLSRRRGALICLVAASVGFALVGWSPIPKLLIEPLEDRFPAFHDDGKPIAGLIVLGGSTDPVLSQARGSVEMNDAAERFTVAVGLARRHPEARLVFTGGDPYLVPSGTTEASLAKKLFIDLGVDPARMSFEDASRNTAENAAFLKPIVRQMPGERWLLITSGWHMPRAMGVFRAQGFDLVPCPVDFQTDGPSDFAPINRIAEGLRIADIAVREWIGLPTYYLTGRSKVLFPAP